LKLLLTHLNQFVSIYSSCVYCL